MNTHEFYVSLETAMMLKEAGFDWELNSRWQDWGGKNSHEFILKTDLFYTDHPAEYDGFHALPAPTLDVAQRWLREVKESFIGVNPIDIEYDIKWQYVIIDYEGFVCAGEKVDVYEEAQESGIRKALEIILENGK